MNMWLLKEAFKINLIHKVSVSKRENKFNIIYKTWSKKKKSQALQKSRKGMSLLFNFY